MLVLDGVEAGYGQARVLFGMGFELRAGEVVTLLGRNGMGKTTTLRSILALVPPSAGRIVFDGTDLWGMAPERIARLGIGLVPEGRQVFPTLTVRENLLATAANRLGRQPAWSLDRVNALFPKLAERAHQRAGTLSGGEQQMLAIGRALMTNPKLLILDEATEGLAPVIRADIWHCLGALKAEGLAILVVDKNLTALERLADRHNAIEKGRVVWSGTRTDLNRDLAQVRKLIGL
jgi:branched-chain amino acid transport system ATP-binding protein